MGQFILRKKQAGRSTQLELVTVEKEGVLKYTRNKILSCQTVLHWLRTGTLKGPHSNLQIPRKASYTLLPLVVYWVGSSDERSDWELVDGGGALDGHRHTDTQRAWNCKKIRGHTRMTRILKHIKCLVAGTGDTYSPRPPGTYHCCLLS